MNIKIHLRTDCLSVIIHCGWSINNVPCCLEDKSNVFIHWFTDSKRATSYHSNATSCHYRNSCLSDIFFTFSNWVAHFHFRNFTDVDGFGLTRFFARNTLVGRFLRNRLWLDLRSWVYPQFKEWLSPKPCLKHTSNLLHVDININYWCNPFFYCTALHSAMIKNLKRLHRSVPE